MKHLKLIIGSCNLSLNSPPASPKSDIKPPLLPPKRTRINSFNRNSNCTKTSENSPIISTGKQIDSLKLQHHTTDPKTLEKNGSIAQSKGISEIKNFNEIINNKSIGSRDAVNFTDCKQDSNENEVVLRNKQNKV